MSEDPDDLILRIREIDNGFLILGRSHGDRLPTKYFPNLSEVQGAIRRQVDRHFNEPEGDEEVEDE